MSLLQDVEDKRTRIHTDSYTVTWSELLSQFKEGSIKIDPDFQRLFRWDYELQSKFIESLILDIPVPALFMYQNEDAILEVIDGLQRFSTLLKFFAPERSNDVREASQEAADENNIDIPTLLTSGTMLKSLKGHSYETLPSKLKRTIKGARVNIILLEQDSSREVKYEVFKRLNKYGVKLSDQEIRNVTGRLYGKTFPRALQTLANNSIIRQSLSLKTSREQKMDIDELVLRFLAFHFGRDLYIHKIDEFLDAFMIHAADGKFILTEEIKRRMLRAFKLIAKAIPDGGAFKFHRDGRFKGPFSPNLYDVVVAGVYTNLEGLTAEKFRQKLVKLHSTKELKALVGAGSNTRKKISGRVDLGHSWFK